MSTQRKKVVFVSARYRSGSLLRFLTPEAITGADGLKYASFHGRLWLPDDEVDAFLEALQVLGWEKEEDYVDRAEESR